MGVKGCWTCRERKVRCDLQRPRCENCTKARRVCQGYGIQLSWPRDGDGKRAIVSRHAVNSRQVNVRRFLNSSSWDVSLAQELEKDDISTRYRRTMQILRPTYLSPTGMNREEVHLLGFFNESRSLILCPTDEEILSQFILRIALSDPSDSSNPVLQGVLALASLQLHGNSKSFRYKHLAVSSVKEPTDEKTLLQNLMAMMLLYHYELSLESSSKGTWVTFFCAVKRIINTSPAVHKLIRQEYSVFLDWFYYHEAIAEFTVRHWHVPYEGCGFAPIARSLNAIERDSGSKVESNSSSIIGCPIDVLQLLVHTCRLAIVTKTPSEIDSAAGELEYTKTLKENISKALGEYGHIPLLATTITTTPPLTRTDMITTLHRLACLIYVNRTTHHHHHISSTDFHHRRLVREGISLLTRMKTCQHAWPLFIIACEATNDEQRLAVLEVFERTRMERRRRSSHVHSMQMLVEGVWKQCDLDVENDREGKAGYLRILDAVVSAVEFMPLFA